MRVKNVSGQTQIWAGQCIENQAYYDIQASELSIWRATDKVIEDITSMNLLVGDDLSYKSTPNEAIAFFLGTLIETAVEQTPPFASKKIKVNGQLKSLFKRVHGINATIASGQTVNIDFTIPYSHVKFTGAEVFGCALGDTLNFTVHDDENNSISGAPTSSPGYPHYLLNQFGFNVEMPNDKYANTSDYDADLYSGMIIRCSYTNNGQNSKYISLNLWLHQVV